MQRRPTLVISLIELASPDAIFHDRELRDVPDRGHHYPQVWTQKHLDVFVLTPAALGEAGDVTWREQRLDLTGGGRIEDLSRSGEFISTAIGDVDGDGASEIVCGVTLSSGATHLLVFHPVGEGWEPRTVMQIEHPQIDYIRAVCAGDVNADGRAEIALSTRPSGVVLLLTRSARGFEQTVIDRDACGPETTNTREIVMGDVDGDGRLEIVAAHAHAAAGDPRLQRAMKKWAKTPGNIRMYRNDSAWGWETVTVEDFGGQTHSRMVLVADVLNNGANQVIVNAVGIYDPALKGISPKSSMRLLEMRGGGFQARHIIDLPLAAKSRGVAAGDVDADGKNELIVGTRSLDIDGYRRSFLLCLKYSAETESWTSQEIDSTGEMGFHTVAVGDIDGDGTDEIVASDDENGLIFSYKLTKGVWRKRIVQKFAHRIFVVRIDLLRQ